MRSADGVTLWADDTKARSELGTVPRGLQEGLRDTYGGRLSVEAMGMRRTDG